MKFMKRDSAEGAAVYAAVQKQAVAHPELAVTFLRDGKQELSTPGDGELLSAVYAVYGRETALDMVECSSSWEKTKVRGYISKPTASRGNRNYQIFFVNGRYVKSPILSAALEEAYKNQMMVGRFPACVLELTMPLGAVDVNIHPAKTEVKFLNERDAFDCVYYAALAALNRTPGRVDAVLPTQETPSQPAFRTPARKPVRAGQGRREPFFRTMTAEQYRAAMTQPKTPASDELIRAVQAQRPPQPPKPAPADKQADGPTAVWTRPPRVDPVPPEPEPEQTEMDLPAADGWRIIGECFSTYFLVEEGDALYLIDKHAAHERILFEKLRAQDRPIPAQALVQPLVCRISREEAACVLEQRELLGRCGFTVEEFGEGAVLLREIPADVDPADARESLSELAQRLLDSRRTEPAELRDELLHTVACKAAIKAGWKTDPLEREALVREVLTREDLKYCPHGRPICIRLRKSQIERQFGRA
jgi:DNA mismatch repair protein MutL